MSRIVLASIGLLLCFNLASSQTHDSEYWRLLFNRTPSQHAYTASHFDVGEASHFLAERYWQQQQRARALAFYQRAVDQGDAGAAYVLARRVPAQREQWLRASAELGDPRASLTIAKELRKEDPVAAIALLEPLAQSDARNDALASLLFNHPHLAKDDLQWSGLAPTTPDWQQRQALFQLFKTESGYRIPASGSCNASFTLYYHGDKARSTAYRWLDRLQQHPFATLGLCFREADISQRRDYQCQQDSVGRAHCRGENDSAGTDFHLHIVGTGIANVRDRHMAIAQSASFDIFIHEMAHLFSLADEYPMREELAQAFCSGGYRFLPLNLVITPAQTREVDYQTLVTLEESLPWSDYLQQPIATPVAGQTVQLSYRLGSPSSDGIGLFKVDTCEGTAYQAWRPVAGMTFMQQHEVGYIPDVYIELMRRYLVSQ